jgi:hypothetical protein
MIEKEHNAIPTVTTLEPMRYGNVDSAISYDKKRESGELKLEIDTAAQEFLKSGEGVIKVHEHDDGCIDGRCTQYVVVTDAEEVAALQSNDVELFVNEDGEFYFKESDSSNHERAKVAGGGYVTGLAARLGAGVKGATADSDIAQLGTDYASKDIVCGAHTGAHMKDVGTDCGANDKLRLILENGAVYKDKIQGNVEGLFGLIGLDFKPEVFEAVIANWQNATSDDAYFDGSTGKSRLEAVLATQEAVNKASGEKPRAVTKHLRDDHNEAYIVVNFIEGTTLSQNALLEKLRTEFPGVEDKDLPQAFVVDAWRVVELANAAVEDDKQELALYAGVAYQLATAATLTDGSLKLFAVTE